jgi:ParB/RepB/Spo0J family partition protein
MTAVASLKRRMPQAHAIDPDGDTRSRGGPRPGLGTPTVLIEVDRIEPHPDNPRDDFDDDDAELLELAESLKSVKLINAVHVEEIDHDSERYRIVAGERRWRAAKLAGWATIPAVICRMDRAAVVRLMVDENLQRKDLNPIEQARAIALLTKPVSEGGCGLSQHEVSRQRGGDESWAAQQVRLLRLPTAWQSRVANGELKQRQAKSLIPFADRPDVLAAVAADMKANPRDWASCDGFDRQLAEVVARLDRVNAVPTGESEVEEFEAEEPMVSRGTLPHRRSASREKTLNQKSDEVFPGPLPHRRSAPVDHSEPEAAPPADGDELSADAVAKVLDSVFDVLDRLKPEQLGLVRTYLDRRARGIEGPYAREARQVRAGKITQ